MIVEYSKFLKMHYSKPIKVCAIEAIDSIYNPETLNDLYRMYDITKEDYINHIVRKIKGEL